MNFTADDARGEQKKEALNYINNYITLEIKRMATAGFNRYPIKISGYNGDIDDLCEVLEENGYDVDWEVSNYLMIIKW
jgi:hypothetical protein